MDHYGIAEQMSTALGRTVTYEPSTLEEFTQAMHERGFDPRTIQHISSVAVDYTNGIFSGTNDIVERLGGIEPTSVATFTRRNRAYLERHQEWSFGTTAQSVPADQNHAGPTANSPRATTGGGGPTTTASPEASPRHSVAIELNQPLVADPEVMRDLVEHDVSDLAAYAIGVAGSESRDWPAEDADLVGKHPAVRAAPSRQRYAAIQPEQRSTSRRLVLDDDLDVAHRRTEIGRQ
jgi:hypothetical protein